jgi:hypothetical protein
MKTVIILADMAKIMAMMTVTAMKNVMIMMVEKL